MVTDTLRSITIRNRLIIILALSIVILVSGGIVGVVTLHAPSRNWLRISWHGEFGGMTEIDRSVPSAPPSFQNGTMSDGLDISRTDCNRNDSSASPQNS